tara:strand:+ start:315 stop:827 length:513 start_codon:yes stop_codon:yes gene_type:complete
MIYLIKAEETNLYKIGYTAGSPKTRMESLQTGCPHKLVLFEHMNGSIEKEKWLHETFKEYRKQGEWFEFDDVILKKVCKKMLEKRTSSKSETEKTRDMLERWIRVYDGTDVSMKYFLELAILEIVLGNYNTAIQRILEFKNLIYGGGGLKVVPKLTEKILNTELYKEKEQ